MTIEPSELSLEQKASLLSGRDFWSTKPIEEAEISSIVLTDGPHGIRLQTGQSDHLGMNASHPATCFPLAVAVGSSWDPGVAGRIGAAVGREARALGVSVVLGPGVNIKRSPLGGRNFEYYSEDPLLSGVLGAAHVAGMQQEGPGASVKHFAANNQETERMRVSADVDERTLREIYLPAFERVVRNASPATVMCSYNRVNGVFASHNPWLLTEVLRKDWGFAGAVVSDWGAVNDRVAGVAAGMDLEMPGSGGGTDAEIVAAVRSGRLSEEDVDTSVRRVLALTELPRVPTGEIEVDEHHVLAREAAADSVVLLKNDGGVLPLSAGRRIAVIGELAARPRFQGGGSSHINATRIDVALDEIRALADDRGIPVEYAPGYGQSSDADAEILHADAVRAAGVSDIAVVFAGLAAADESEGFDRDSIVLPAEQVTLIRAVAVAAPCTVVVLTNGGVVSLEGWHDDVDAIIEGFLLGQAGGGALADVLFGVVNPSGHLAETIPLRLEDTPSWMNFPGEQGHVRYGEGMLVGYRYYVTADVPVRYPFGHGLSYTTFETAGLDVTATGPDTAVARVRVSNSGDRPGKHVVQIYVGPQAGPVRRPLRELRAFDKVELAPGETRTVEVVLDHRAFAYWDVKLSRWVVAAGDYDIQVCTDAHTVITSTCITLSGNDISRPLTLDSTVGEWFAHPVAGPALRDEMWMTPEQAGPSDGSTEMLRMVESMPMKQFAAFLGGAVPVQQLEHLMTATMTTANIE
ncbi:glycoside hydrolase family 3 C-terminal domain-containing protein [Nocardia sp. NPDC058499]|uniref:glycoside hydrolase family 3 C-terminal domain-containing protein n=1 Tax=Nocardia sp. NPDC058499 TaxID=3346530 RepID=UPI003659B635